MHQRTYLTGEFLMQVRAASSCIVAHSRLLMSYTSEPKTTYHGTSAWFPNPHQTIFASQGITHVCPASTVPSQHQRYAHTMLCSSAVSPDAAGAGATA